MAFCTNCGTELRVDGRFCTGCGAPRPVAGGPTVSVPTAVPQAVPIPGAGTQFTMIAGIAGIAAGLLALLAIFLPNRYDKLFGFWHEFELFSIPTGLIVGLIAAGVCSLVLGPQHPHWAVGSVAASATFVAILLEFHLATIEYGGVFRSPRAGGAVAFLAAACSVAGAVFAVLANVRAGTLKIAVDPRFAAIGFAAAGAVGLTPLLSDFGDPFIYVTLLHTDLWGKAAILVLTGALAGSVVIGTLVGLRACIAAAGVVLVIIAFYLLGVATDWPGESIAAGFALMVIGAGLVVALIVRCITLLQAQASIRD